tara:strand:+ start:8100 stop:8585 length:486 start_codon:yes stop_codon:yes gene_type:complete
MNFTSSIHQIYFFLIISLTLSITVNLFRPKPILYIAKSLEMIKDIDQISKNASNPMIRTIDIEIAKTLFENNALFVDARAEEYFKNGHISNAICNDDINLLIEEIDSRIQVDESFIVYCSDDDCGSSEELAYTLQEQGFMNIYVFKGGWKQWTNYDLPVSK